MTDPKVRDELDDDELAELEERDKLTQVEQEIEDLRELRRELRSALKSRNTPASALAGISKELRNVNAELGDRLASEEQETEAERIKRERAARRANAADSPPSRRRK